MAESNIFVTSLSDSSYRKNISRKACMLSNLMKSMLDDDDDKNVECELPFDDSITPRIMDLVLKFMEYHAENPMNEIKKPIESGVIEEIVGEWDAGFIKLEQDQETLVDLILAANYFDCQSLLDLGVLKIATMIYGKEPDQVKDMFGIDKDITEEEERAIRDSNMWVFDLGQNKETPPPPPAAIEVE